jgi:hypothetical protein
VSRRIIVRRGVLASDAEDDGERRGDERPDDDDDRDRSQPTSAVCLEDKVSRTAIRLQPASRLRSVPNSEVQQLARQQV